MVLAWLVVAAVFAVAEMLTLAAYAAFLSAGAVAAAGAAALGFGPVAQAAVLLAVSVIGVLAVRPFLLRAMHRPPGSAGVSGAAEMIGRTALVVEDIPGAVEPGHVALLGERWPAVTSDGTAVAAGRTVIVAAIRRATLVVDPAA